MSYIKKLEQIDKLQAEIQAHGILSTSLLNKINYKLRLEWNYTSNSMEGNTLTKRETRTVMVGLIDVNDKPLKDIIEIKNHDKVISTIMKVGKGELNISESRIKEIHKGIMYEEDAEKQKYIGQWKNVDNYMININGERYDFVSHSDVKEHIHQLINWINKEKEKIDRNQKDASHPALLAFKFHLDYLTIHPFYDGNGRTARILSNLILISYGFPPLYIKENEKQKYYQYLTDIQSYGGNPDLFYEFMADLLLRSIQITSDTIAGKEIEEDDDFIKEIQLLKNKAKVKGVPKSPLLIYNAYKQINAELWQTLITTLSHFGDMFNESKITRKVNFYDESFGTRPKGIYSIMSSFQESTEPAKLKIFGHDVYEVDIETISWTHIMFGLNGAESPIDFIIELKITFNHYNYNIDLMMTGDGKWSHPQSIYSFEKLYDEAFLPEEIDDLNAVLKKQLIEKIKQALQEDL
jgi:Fic family protein